MAETATPKMSPEEATKAAAHYFLSELRTRISTQPLPYQHGDEARALESLWEVFGQAREAMKKYPGCVVFADKVTEMLNLHLRPVTAKWHRAKIEGRLDSRDGADEFRGDLATVQRELKEFASELHVMAYQGAGHVDDDAPDVIDEDDLKEYLKELSFGIKKIDFVSEATVKDINDAEAKAVAARRECYGVMTPGGKNAIGLALSGGGIRSATFCLGVVQVLAKRGLFKDIDFLSTVSGGGYAGCFITTRLGAGPKPANAEIALRQAAIAGPNGPDPVEIRYLRRHAKYLAALNIKQAWLMVTGTLTGMLLNWMAPLSVVVLAAALTSICGERLAAAIRWLPIVMAGIAGISAFLMLVYGSCLARGGRAATVTGNWLAGALALTAAIGAIWLLQAGYQWAIDFQDWVKTHWAWSGVVTALVTAGPAIIRFIPVVKNPKVRKIALQVLLWLAAVIVPLGAVLLFYLLFYYAHDSRGVTAVLFVVGALFVFFTCFLLNINQTGPHRLYRNQLAGTFVDTRTNKEDVLLSTINASELAPYHLINTTLNVPNSQSEALRERKSDFFLFSKEYCGAPSIGYDKTTTWKTNAKTEPDLATAMAISGAAASSYMGLGSMPTLTALLTFLNVRLGFWILNRVKKPQAKGYPGFTCLMREMFGFSMSEKNAWLNLSDGGHIENLGIYELLRRRCKLIIGVDGESDPTYTFQGLMTLVRHAQIDFGARIDVNLSDIRPDPKTGYSQAHAALCTVHYPPAPGEVAGSIGFIIYMKLSVTGNESELIRRYRINHPDFPHQTTLDQFFDEEQFEAYRQLGAHVANGLFLKALLDQGEVGNVPDWFKKLIKNLLPKKIELS